VSSAGKQTAAPYRIAGIEQLIGSSKAVINVPAFKDILKKSWIAFSPHRH
jgi:hypothetical protein